MAAVQISHLQATLATLLVKCTVLKLRVVKDRRKT